MPAAWMSQEQRALEKALRAGVQVYRAKSSDGHLLLRWSVDSASTYGKRYEVRMQGGRFSCTCLGVGEMCLHRAAVMWSLGRLTLDPPKCRNCHQSIHRGRCKPIETPPSGNDEYARLFGAEE